MGFICIVAMGCSAYPEPVQVTATLRRQVPDSSVWRFQVLVLQLCLPDQHQTLSLDPDDWDKWERFIKQIFLDLGA